MIFQRAREKASEGTPVIVFKDFNSGAMIQNVVDRAKKNAIKSVLETGQPGLRIQHLLDSIVDEFAENEDLPNTTNPDDWARISGKKGGSSTSARWSPASRRAHRGPSIRDTRKLAGGERQPEHE